MEGNSVNSSFNVSYQIFTYLNMLQNHLIEFEYTNIVQVIRNGGATVSWDHEHVLFNLSQPVTKQN